MASRNVPTMDEVDLDKPCSGARDYGRRMEVPGSALSSMVVDESPDLIGFCCPSTANRMGITSIENHPFLGSQKISSSCERYERERERESEREQR